MIIGTHVRTLLTLPVFAIAGLAAACDPQVDPEYQGEALARVQGTVDGAAPQASGTLEVAAMWFASSSTECSGPAEACSVGAGGMDGDFACVEACGEPDTCEVELLDAFVACVEQCGTTVEAEYSIDWELCVDAAVTSNVPVVGQFPAMFDLDLFSPPPDEALLTSSSGGPAVALAWLLVVDDNAPEALSFHDVDESGIPGVLGVSEKHMLMYAAEAVPADSAWGQMLGGAYEPGYHVIDVIGGECWEEPVYPGGGCMVGEECTPIGSETVCELSTLQPSAADLDTEITVTLGAWDDLQFPMPG